MRPVLHALLGLLALALWGSGLLWGWRFPWEVTIRPAQVTPAPDTAGAPLVLRAEVTATYPQLEGLALGDRVQFDRYGLLAPTHGSVLCVPLPASGAVQVTPIGGRLTHAGSIQLTRVPAGTAGCEQPAGVQPVLSLHP